VRTRAGGLLLNLCPRSLYVAARDAVAARAAVAATRAATAGEAPAGAAEDHARRVDYVTALRTAEDAAFAQRCGLSRHDLPFEAPPVRGARPFDLRDLKAQVARFRAPLLGAIEAFVRRHAPQPVDLFCPMGIGGHADHVASMIVVAQALPVLSGRARVHFYEDLHYASDAVARRIGLARASIALGHAPLRRHAFALDAAALADKMATIALYASQHDGAPDARRFSPAADAPAGPHEAVWSFPGAGPGAPFGA